MRSSAAYTICVVIRICYHVWNCIWYKYMSMFRINNTFQDGHYDISDPTIYSAVNKKGKGGCVEVFVELEGLSKFF